MHGLASLVLDNLKSVGAMEHPAYEAMLSHAFAVAPPPFGENWFGRRYFELARRADWFANSLVANAALEGYGSTQIWAFSRKLNDENYAAAAQQHSLDESRHSTMFVEMIGLLFPDATIDGTTQASLDRLQPKYNRRSHPPIDKVPEGERFSLERTLEEFVGVQFTEIRALILQFLLQAMTRAYSPPASSRKLEAMTSILIRDESRHIDYVANIVEREASLGNRDLLFTLFEQGLHQFNDITMMELERDKITI